MLHDPTTAPALALAIRLGMLKTDYERVCEAAVDLLAKLKAEVATGRYQTCPEMEALEIALTLPGEGEAHG